MVVPRRTKWERSDEPFRSATNRRKAVLNPNAASTPFGARRGAGKLVLHLPEQVDVGLADGQRFLAVLQAHMQVATEIPVEPRDGIDIDERRPVNPPEHDRIESASRSLIGRRIRASLSAVITIVYLLSAWK